MEIALRWDPPNRAVALVKGFELANQAVALDPSLSSAHLVLGDLRRAPSSQRCGGTIR